MTFDGRVALSRRRRVALPRGARRLVREIVGRGQRAKRMNFECPPASTAFTIAV